MLKHQKKLLIAGGGYADIPLIKSAKELGFHVITSGNLPKALGHRESDEYQKADFSDPRAMLALAKKLDIQAICASANDFSALSSAYVAEQLGLPGHDPYETARIIHHKDRFREFARLNRISSPKAKGFIDQKSALRMIEGFQFPLIVKPVDLTGGKGISKINNISEANQALGKAFTLSKSKRIVVEEFIVGSRHACSTFVQDGKVIFHFSDNEYYYLNPYLVSGTSTPALVPQKVIDILIKQVEKIVSLLSLKTGIVHVQFILRNNKLTIIEICRRAPGDLYLQFVQYATGLDYASWIIKSAAGFDCSDLAKKEVQGYFARHCIMPSQNGRLQKITIDRDLEEHIIDQFMWWKPGESVENYLTHKFGIIFFHFDSMDEMLEKSNNIQNLITVKMDH